MLDFSAYFLIALIQGITEFLPVSSSGHLVLIPHITAFADQGQVMDVAAHIGTLAAVMLYLRQDITAMLVSLLAPTVDKMRYRWLTGLLIIASLPVIIAGLLLELAGAEFLRIVWIVASANLVFALWLWVADKQDIKTNLSRSDTRQPEWEKLSYRHALYIGLAQICALIPGASRSGVTMTMARQLGYDRLSAARFSLLLSVPVIAGAGVLKGVSLYRTGEGVDLLSLGLVAGLSFIFALLAIRWMMGWLARADFRIFVVYRLGLGIVLIELAGAQHPLAVKKAPARAKDGQIFRHNRLDRSWGNAKFCQTRGRFGTDIICLQQFQLIICQRRVWQKAREKGWDRHQCKWHGDQHPLALDRGQNKAHQFSKAIAIWPAKLVNSALCIRALQRGNHRTGNITDKNRLHQIAPTAYQRQGRGQHRHLAKAEKQPVAWPENNRRLQDGSLREFSKQCALALCLGTGI